MAVLKISVAMCTYNGARFIREQLESILGQTRVPDEIVICDDGSVDDTLGVARETLAGFSGRVQLVANPENLGFAKNFEKAISLCGGDIIFLSDQDDVWQRDKLEKMCAIFAERDDVILAFHDSALVDSQLRPLQPSFWACMLPPFHPEEFECGDYRHLFMVNMVQGSACAFRRALFAAAAPLPPEAYHDEWLALTAIGHGQMLPIRETLMQYRQGNNVIGGMHPSLLGRIYGWLTRFHRKAEVRMGDLRRREAVLQAAQERFASGWTEEEREALDFYLHFIRERFALFEHCQLSHLHPQAYRRAYRERGRYFLLKDLCIALCRIGRATR